MPGGRLTHEDTTMTSTDDEVQHRRSYTPDPDYVELRDADDVGDGLLGIRMPLSSTTLARDDKAFDTDRLEGWRDQINDGDVGVFLDHGMNHQVGGSRYSSTGKVGYWADAELEERGDDTDLDATAVIMDPETLPAETGTLREALSVLKAQIDRGIPITASAGWNDDVGDRDVPGGSDLLEGSIVGIPADPRASTHDAVVAHARDALDDADLDDDTAEAIVADFRSALTDHDFDMTDHDIDNLADRTAFDVEQLREMDEDALDALAATLDERDADDGDDDPDEPADAREGDKDDDVGERLAELRDMNEEELNLLREMADDDDDDDDGDGENAADTDDTDERSVTIDGEEMSASDALEALRDAVDDAEPADSETETRGDEPDDEGDDTPDDERDADPEPTFSFN